MYVLFSKLTKHNHDLFISKCRQKFTDKTKKRISEYRFWNDAQSSILGRLLLQEGSRILGVDYTENDIRYSKNNKPIIHDRRFEFNISHSDNIVVCAITLKCDLGIDIEKIKQINVDNFKHQMTSIEYQRIMDSNNSLVAFYDYWTQKEAVIKAHGDGLSIPLESFEIHNNLTKIKSNMFFLNKLEINNEYICHIATTKKIESQNINIINIAPTYLLSM